jgi:hypothetical protein
MRGEHSVSIPAGPGDAQSVPGSTSGAFTEAFLWIFVLGGALVFGLLNWEQDPLIKGNGLYLWLLVLAGLSALLARFASFQVATLVTITPEGIRADWRGPFGGRSSQRVTWNDLRGISVVRGLVPTVTFQSHSSVFSIYVTTPQARAILRYPACPLKDLPPRVVKTLKLGTPR